jgi:hypothetical protein
MKDHSIVVGDADDDDNINLRPAEASETRPL